MRNAVKVHFDNGGHIVATINGTEETITQYYVGKQFNLGVGERDFMAVVTNVEFLGEQK